MEIDVDYSDLSPGISPHEEAIGSKRLVQIILGIFLVVVGIPMIPLMGPGWAVVLVGLNLIKPDNAVVRFLRRRLPGVPDEGPVPKRYFAIGGVLLVASGIVGALYGYQVVAWARTLVGI